MYVVEGIRHQSEEMGGVVDCFCGRLVEIFSELAPETVLHEFWGWLCLRGFSGLVWV